MKFLKASVVVFFFLSLASSGLTLYLSTVRENEKEKRLQLEQLKVQLEEHVSSLESEKAQAESRISELNTKVEDLEERLQKEQAERAKAAGLVRQKEEEVKNIKSEMLELDKAFANAQKRNRQLEQILDELEARVKEMEAQKTQPEPEVGFIQLDVTPQAPASSPAVNVSSPSTVVPAAPAAISQAPKPVLTEKPKKKKRKFFSFLKFGRGKKKAKDVPPGWEPVARQEKAASQTPPAEIKPKVIPDVVPAKAVGPALPQRDIKPVSVPVVKTEPPKREVRPAPKKEEGASGGRVLLINRKFNFVVADLGSKQGLELDDLLVIERKGTPAAKARVEKLYDDYCAAYLVEEQSETPFEEGDLIRLA